LHTPPTEPKIKPLIEVTKKAENPGSIGPGAYNPVFENVKSKTKTMILYKQPKPANRNVVDKIYQYINEVKSMSFSDQKIDSQKSETQKYKQMNKNNSNWLGSRAEKINEIARNESPGPGSYNAVNNSFLLNKKSLHRRGTFGTQKRSDIILNKDNKILIKTCGENDVPGAGTYFYPFPNSKQSPRLDNIPSNFVAS